VGLITVVVVDVAVGEIGVGIGVASAQAATAISTATKRSGSRFVSQPPTKKRRSKVKGIPTPLVDKR
ncbi:MAG: hypothetical protein V3U90_05465, partial [Dehalococcoidia bacterium]